MKKSTFIDYAVLMAVRSRKKKKPAIDKLISVALAGGKHILHQKKNFVAA